MERRSQTVVRGSNYRDDVNDAAICSCNKDFGDSEVDGGHSRAIPVHGLEKGRDRIEVLRKTSHDHHSRHMIAKMLRPDSSSETL